MERAYFRGKQAGHLSRTSGKRANPPDCPWEKERTHLPQVSSPRSAKITWLQLLLQAALSDFSPTITAALPRREEGQGFITEHLQIRGIGALELLLHLPPMQKGREGGLQTWERRWDVGRCWNLRVVWQLFIKYSTIQSHLGLCKETSSQRGAGDNSNFLAHGAGIEEGGEKRSRVRVQTENTACAQTSPWVKGGEK